MLELLKIIPILIAAVLVGNWFLSEVKKARAKGEKWYKPYLTVPGLLILVILFLPLVLWVVQT